MMITIRNTLSRVAVVLLASVVGSIAGAQANTQEISRVNHQYAEIPAPSAISNQIPKGALPAVLDAISPGLPAAYGWLPLTGADGQAGQAYQAVNTNQQQEYQLVGGALELSIADQQAEHLLRFQLSAYGWAGDLHPLGVIKKTEFPNNNQLRQYYSGELEEWFVNSPVGLEHGFTLNQPPAGSASQAVVVLALGVSGDLIPQVDADARGVSFNTAQGETLLGYRGLVAYDRTGRHLPVTLQQADSQIQMHVDVAGARYPVTVDPLFQTESKLDAGSTYKEGGARFGWSVDVDGDWMAVGAPYEDAAYTDSGAVYLFKRSGLSWVYNSRITPSTSEFGARFGYSVALSGNTLVSGAPYATANAAAEAGIGYVFEYAFGCFNGFFYYSCWQQKAALSPSGLANANDHFAWSVAIDGDNLVLGNKDDLGYGSIMVFTRNAGTWPVTGTRLLSSSHGSGDQVGFSVAIQGNYISAGAPLDDAAGADAGAVYQYMYDGSQWVTEYKVLGATAGDQLGHSVDIDGTRMIAGAPYADPGGLGSAGAAYIYSRRWNKTFSAYEWLKLTTLIPLQADNSTADAAVSDYFGRSVAIDLDSGGEGTGYALVSAPYNDDNGSGSGAAYLYADDGSGSNWSQIKKLTAHDAAASEYYGHTGVALGSRTVVIGSPYEDDAGFSNNGAAYVVGTQADSYLTLDLDQHAVLRSGAINAVAQLVVGSVSAPDAALSGLQVSLLVCTEADTYCDSPYKILTGTTDEDGKVYFTPLSGAANPGPGYYRVIARLTDTVPDYWEFPADAGDTIVVQQNSGYAVIIEGANVDPENNGEPSHNKTANRIYETLLQRGFTDDRIYYFNQRVGDPDRPGVDAHADTSELDSWLLNSAGSLQNYLRDIPGPLHFFLVSHGERHPTNGSGRFILNPGDGVTPEEMSSQEINGILNTLQTVPSMANWPVAITIASCYSGAHIPDVSSLLGRGRVVVTSTMDDQQGYKGPLESSDRIRGGSFFAEEFVLELKQDLSYKQAFRKAAVRTAAYTQRDDAVDSLSGQYIDNAMQNPLLDDDGDSYGTNNLSDAAGIDGSIARDVYLGVGAWEPETNYIVTPTLYLSAPDAVDLQLYDYLESIDAVDVEIRPPGTTLLDDLDSEQSATDYLHASMTRVGTTNAFTMPFDFQFPGKWEIWYRPEGAGVLKAVVYVSDGNVVNGPGAFNLLKPGNNEPHAKTRQLFDWQQSVDLSGDAVTYKLLIASSGAATNGVLDTPLFSQDEIYSSLYYLRDRVLEDGASYYWQVIAIDSFGHQTPSEIWSFTTDDTNLVGGPLVGNILDSSTALGVKDALVQVTPTAAYSQEGGYFIVTDGIAGPNSATASKATYNEKTTAVVLSYNPSVSTEENFSLQQDAPDTDGDGVVDSVDNCQEVRNETQSDIDDDGQGDACDLDDDNDGTEDEFDCLPRDAAGETLLATGACVIDDSDDDNDGTVDTSDCLPLDPAGEIELATGACVINDGDDDNDGTGDGADCLPLDPAGEILLTTGACVVDDTDDDNDGVPDVSDAFRLNPTEWVDTDGDATGNNADTDDDNDGVADALDISDLDPTRCTDSDGDSCDDCSIGVDGFGPGVDKLPLNDGPDLDVDGLCDAGDPDIDNDGVLNDADWDALNAYSCSDTDGDSCDDCSSGTYAPLNDGPDYNTDGICDLSDPPVASADGDLNVDGVVDVRDVLLAQRILLGQVDINADPNYLIRGDVAPPGPPVGNGIFDLGDALVIQRMALEL